MIKIFDICFLTALLRHSRGVTTPRYSRFVKKQISLILPLEGEIV